MRETRWKGNLVSLGSVLLLLPRGLFNNPFPRDVINENSSDSAAIVFSTRFAHSRSWSTMVISLKIGNGHGSMWNCASWLLLWFRDSPTGSPHWWPGTPGILKMIYISRNLMPVGCFTGPTTLDFMKFNISRPRNYGLMDFTTESTESWMRSNGIYIYISRSISAIWLYYLLIHFFIFLLFPHIVQRNWCGSSIDWFGVHWRYVKRKFRKSVVFRKIFLRDRRESCAHPDKANLK